MKSKMILKASVSVVAMMVAFCGWASPWTLPAKAVVEAAEKVGAHTGGHVAGAVAVRGGAALAEATARREAAKAVACTAAGKVVEKASPGKIIAAGVATATVVGAHEVADGVQNIGETISEVVRENPETAPGVLHELLMLPKIILALVCVGVMGLVGWLLCPCFELARSWVRLVAARKAHALAVAPVTLHADPVAAQGFLRGSVRLGVIWSLVGLLLLTALGIWRFVSDRNGTSVLPLPPKNNSSAEAIDRRSKVVAGFRKQYQEAIERHHANFLTEVDSTAQAEFGRVRDGIPGVVEQFGTMSRCTELLKTIVLDKWNGSALTEESLKRDLEVSYYGGLYAARDNVAKCLQHLVANIADARRAFSIQLQDELATIELPGDDEYKALLEDCGVRVEKSKKDLLIGQVVAGISLSVEAVCIRQTVSTVVSLLGKAAARQAGTMAAGAGAAIADGPLPIGDIVGGVAVVGCTLWTWWDINEATNVLPAKLAETLNGVTRDCEKKSREEMLRLGEEVVARAL
ncbi:MAG: hypothetical protein II840_07645 [Kiritimatiellae bacterium]|nr:hypothetical protein [Kiritimatiellia bacterium]